jgi:hypothetical protein
MGKLATIPLLLKTSLAALPAYLGGAMALYVFYKLARRDFQAWIPTAGAGASLVHRVFGKLYVDFSGNPHFRHPYDMGGAAYVLTLCETQGTLVASTVAYSRLYAGDDKIDDAPLFTALAVLVGTWAIALGTFLLSINRTHLNTFVSTETGPHFVRGLFDHFVGNDEQRMEIFTVHPSMWASFARCSSLGRAAARDDVRATVVHARSEGAHSERLSAPGATAVARSVSPPRPLY